MIPKLEKEDFLNFSLQEQKFFIKEDKELNRLFNKKQDKIIKPSIINLNLLF